MKRLRIAVAEDEWLIAEDLRVQLEALGHTVVEIARTGEELVSAVARARPDVALVDIKLARGSDGLAAAQEVQERLGVPAIAVTGHLTPEEASEAGLLGLVQKPITPTKLRAMLGRAARKVDGGGRRLPGSRERRPGEEPGRSRQSPARAPHLVVSLRPTAGVECRGANKGGGPCLCPHAPA